MTNLWYTFNFVVHSLFFRHLNLLKYGVPGGIRTHDLQLRRLIATITNCVYLLIGCAISIVPHQKTYPHFKLLNYLRAPFIYGTQKMEQRNA